MVTKSNEIEITEAEAELYDRQIRLWGIDSQKKLRNGKILIIGMQGFGAEVAKNIILAGVKSVTLLDHTAVSIEDSSAQFLVPTDSLGQNRAEASLKRAQALNPMVNVIADTANVSTKTDEYFAEFDVVVATCCDQTLLKRINTACRLRNVKFFCGDVFGMFGYIIADLLIHEYVEEIPTIGKEKLNSVKMTKTYLPLVEVLTYDWSQTPAQKLRKMDPSYFLMLVLFDFRKQNGRVPDRSQREKDIEKLKEISGVVLSSHCLPFDKIPESLFGLVFGEVSPVCAIVGGVLAQEIIKTVSQKNATMNNCFFFNPDKCCGFMESLSNCG